MFALVGRNAQNQQREQEVAEIHGAASGRPTTRVSAPMWVHAEAVSLYTCCSTSYLLNSQPAINLIGSGFYHQPFSARFTGLSSVCPVGIIKIKLTLSFEEMGVRTAALIYHTQKTVETG